MYFTHAADIWNDFPELVAGVVQCGSISNDKPVALATESYFATAKARLAQSPESEMPEIQAWRRAFARMGLKPTQHRCAAESLLRRYRKEGQLPSINPLIDVCNAISVAYATPIAVFDISKVADHIVVRYADGDEIYLTFSDEVEHPENHEVIFADADKRAHARRWTNRQSGYSAVHEPTTDVLIVTEAMHSSALTDMQDLLASLEESLSSIWKVSPRTSILSEHSPRFNFDQP